MHCSKPLIIISFFILCEIQAKGQYDFTADVTEGCTPLKVKFTFVSTATADSVATYYWSFGNGETSYEMDPDTVVFEAGGIYDPVLVLVFAGGTESWITKTGLITVHNTVRAGFNYSVSSESFYYFTFEQTSVENNTEDYDFVWDFEDVGMRTGPNPGITFPDTDTFSVSLTVTDNSGCSSSITKYVTVLDKIEVPNVFTPGGEDIINNYFIIRSNGEIPLRIRIFSRTGILVYETEGPVITWNGETASGDKLKTGIYYYSLEAISGDPQKIYTKTGFFHMYRKD